MFSQIKILRFGPNILLSTAIREVCQEAGPPSPLLTAPVKDTEGV